MLDRGAGHDSAGAVSASGVSPVFLNSTNPSQVYVVFSEGVRIDTATNLANYSITSANGSLGLSNATLLPGSTTVALTTGPQAAGTLYTLTVNGVVDLRRPRTWWPPTARRRSRRRIF